MTLLDRFRTQPRDKHPDPAVRLAYVAEIPLSERDAIAAMACEDEDPKVRQAAVAKLLDPARLGRIAREDADESVRSRATEMLRDIALDTFEGMTESESLDAVDALDDSKLLTQIAKSSARDLVAIRALSRTMDPHGLGSIARHAVAEAARRGAFDLLRERGERGEILAVAMNAEHKDSALAAVEAVIEGGDRAALEQIAERGKNKAASKRARGVLREAEERAAKEAAEAAARAAALVSERHAANAAALAASVPVSRGPAVSLPAEPPAEDAERRRLEEERQRVRDEQRAQEEASAAAARAAAAAEDHERRRARLLELAAGAMAAAEDAELASARKRFGAVRREWKTLSAGIDVDPAVSARFGDADVRMAARDAEAHEADARARREALGHVQQLLARVEPVAAKGDATLKAADRALRDVRTALAHVPPLPSKQDFEDVGHRLKAAHTSLTQKVHELREAAEWQQWANAGVQEQLCVKMEALRSLEDPEAIAAEVRLLQQQWRDVADVPRAKADALWRRFKAAHDEVWAKCEAHFSAQAEERAANLQQKIALCEKAEALADSTSWIQTAEAIKALQAEWKTIGPVTRGREKAIWDRFRAACDRFFTRRHQDLAQRKAAWGENFAKKEALVVKAEALADSTDWDAAAAEIKRLQNEWRTIGPVKKSRSDAIWQRFRGACDAFFTRYARRHDVAREERAAARDAICAELEALAAPTADEAASLASGEPAPVASGFSRTPQDLLATVRGLRAKWQSELAQRGVEPERARILDDRFAAAFAQVLARWPSVFGGTDLDPDANRVRMEALVNRMEELAASLAGPPSAAAGADASLSPTTRLAAMLKEALAANTIGGKVEEDSRVRAAVEDVRKAQASWSRLGMVPEAARRVLADRFQRACRQIEERAGGAGKAGGAGRATESSQAPRRTRASR